ncbi:MAG TPA: L,D-transpeptidase [Chthoniobacteraceae bacterium]|nr:L,D-transpeptidase [Chthoniobacteraceae bacterium]
MQSPRRKIRVSISDQRLDLLEGEKVVATFPVSTSAFGTGAEPGSFKTPTGIFCIAEKIGDGAAHGAVFRSRVPTGETGGEENPEDLIQTRILWLAGLEPHNANTRDRYIYIHGTNHESQIGRAASHGCVRMRNADVAELYELVDKGMEVVIEN